jgi:hypothetical protein
MPIEKAYTPGLVRGVDETIRRRGLIRRTQEQATEQATHRLTDGQVACLIAAG